MMSPQLDNLGSATLEIFENESDSDFVETLNSFPLTLNMN